MHDGDVPLSDKQDIPPVNQWERSLNLKVSMCLVDCATHKKMAQSTRQTSEDQREIERRKASYLLSRCVCVCLYSQLSRASSRFWRSSWRSYAIKQLSRSPQQQISSLWSKTKQNPSIQIKTKHLNFYDSHDFSSCVGGGFKSLNLKVLFLSGISHHTPFLAETLNTRIKKEK